MKMLTRIPIVCGTLLVLATSASAFSLLDSAKTPGIIELEKRLNDSEYALSQIRDLKARGGSASMSLLYEFEFVDLSGSGRKDRKFIAHWDYIDGDWVKNPKITEE